MLLTRVKINTTIILVNIINRNSNIEDSMFPMNLAQPCTKDTCSFIQPSFYSTKIQAIVQGHVQKGKRESLTTITRVPYSIMYCPRYSVSEKDTWPSCLSIMSNSLEIEETLFGEICANLKKYYPRDRGLLQFASFLEYWKGKCIKVTRHFDTGKY